MIEKLVYDKDTEMFVDPEGTSWMTEKGNELLRDLEEVEQLKEK